MNRTSISMYTPRKIRIESMIAGNNLEIQDLIKSCLKILAPKIRKRGFQSNLRKYQDCTYLYKSLHFDVSDAEYAIYLDLQKVSKMCLSKLIAIALDLFAEKVIKNRILDNYQFTEYKSLYFVYKSRQIYMFFWDELVDNSENSDPLIE
jgi:hypothetical protein